MTIDCVRWFTRLAGVSKRPGREAMREGRDACIVTLMAPVNRLRGAYLDPPATIIELSDFDQVGAFSWIKMQFVNKNGTPHVLVGSDDVQVTTQGSAPISFTHVRDGNTLTVNFSVTTAGSYTFSIRANGQRIGADDLCRVFVAGPIDERHCSVADIPGVMRVGEGLPIVVTVLDQYGNAAAILPEHIRMTVSNESESEEGPAELVFYASSRGTGQPGTHCVNIGLTSEGCFYGMLDIYCNGDWRTLRSRMMLIALGEQAHSELDKAVLASESGKLDAVGLSAGTYKGCKLSVQVTRKRMVVRYYYMYLVPTKALVCRVAPVTEVSLYQTYPGCKSQPVLSVCERGSEPFVIGSPHRSLICALFRTFLQMRFVLACAT